MKRLTVLDGNRTPAARPAAPPSAPPPLVQGGQRDPAMARQKAMLAKYFTELSTSAASGRKIAYTFVPGNLIELLRAFDILPVYPEINALQSAMRQKSADFIREAERLGHNEDVCTYVKCDIGMLTKGNIGPTGERLPSPDVLLLSYTGCFTFMKWFELLRKEHQCPVAMLHVPYAADGVPTEEMRRYVADQLRREVIPILERATGRRYDEDRLREVMARSAAAEDDLVAVLESAKNRPSPIDAYFGAVYYISPIFTAFRGGEDCIEYYRALRADIADRIARGAGPTLPDGSTLKERFRLVVEGPPNWTHFNDFWKIFSDEGVVFVASTYTKVGGLYDRGFRHSAEGDPLLSLADYCMGCYTNLSLPQRIDLLEQYVRDYHADGYVFNSIKSCNSFSAGQLVMMRELEQRTGTTGAFIESDLVDPRYYSHANIKNRIESYLRVLGQKSRPERVGGGAA